MLTALKSKRSGSRTLLWTANYPATCLHSWPFSCAASVFYSAPVLTEYTGLIRLNSNWLFICVTGITGTCASPALLSGYGPIYGFPSWCHHCGHRGHCSSLVHFPWERDPPFPPFPAVGHGSGSNFESLPKFQDLRQRSIIKCNKEE